MSGLASLCSPHGKDKWKHTKLLKALDWWHSTGVWTQPTPRDGEVPSSGRDCRVTWPKAQEQRAVKNGVDNPLSFHASSGKLFLMLAS